MIIKNYICKLTKISMRKIIGIFSILLFTMNTFAQDPNYEELSGSNLNTITTAVPFFNDFS